MQVKGIEAFYSILKYKISYKTEELGLTLGELGFMYIKENCYLSKRMFTLISTISSKIKCQNFIFRNLKLS